MLKESVVPVSGIYAIGVDVHYGAGDAAGRSRFNLHRFSTAIKDDYLAEAGSRLIEGKAKLTRNYMRGCGVEEIDHEYRVETL